MNIAPQRHTEWLGTQEADVNGPMADGKTVRPTIAMFVFGMSVSATRWNARQVDWIQPPTPGSPAVFKRRI
jgi:hypothetical protein